MNKESRVRLGENGEIRIPAVFCKALGIRVGEEVVLRIENDELRISSLTQSHIARAQRLVRKYVKPGTSLVDELIAERRGARPHLKC